VVVPPFFPGSDAPPPLLVPPLSLFPFFPFTFPLGPRNFDGFLLFQNERVRMALFLTMNSGRSLSSWLVGCIFVELASAISFPLYLPSLPPFSCFSYKSSDFSKGKMVLKPTVAHDEGLPRARSYT